MGGYVGQGHSESLTDHTSTTTDTDVEFPSRHMITSQEAMDVAIPAVLDEAAVALSSSTDDFDFISMSEVNSGWSSPSALSTSNSVSGLSGIRGAGTPKSRSPTRATSSAVRGLSPDGSYEGMGRSRGYSSPSRRNSVTPGTSKLLSSGSTQATPLPLGSASYEPTTTFSPFVQHLSEALHASTLSPSPSVSPSQVSFSTPPTPNDSFILAGAPFLPSLSNSLNHPQQSEMGGLLPNGLMNEGRRLSFTSYADILNEERLAELVGSPLGSGGIPGV